MSKQGRRGGRAFIWGTVWGALAAAAVVLWRAPRSGEETRAKLAKLIGDSESVQEALQQGKAEARRLNAK
jgi:gas vesicle protein